jgi:phosphomannomutase
MNTTRPNHVDPPLMLSVSGARGLMGLTMTPVVAARFAAAFGSRIAANAAPGEAKRVCIGRDGRAGGEALAAAIAGALAAVGLEVVDLGVATTPTVGVAIRHHRALGGMVVTASHNPQQWNGLKCLDGDGLAPPPAIAHSIIEDFKADRATYAAPTAIPRIRRDEAATDFHVERVLECVDVEAIRKARLVAAVDSVNASGSRGAALLLDALGVAMHQIHGDPSGVFPHTPEPLAENLVGLAEATRAHGASVGFAQDPDADRLAIVDERGVFIGEEYTLALAALRAFERFGSGVAAANLSTSRLIDAVAARFPGSSVIRTAVGEANVVAALKAHDGVVGGEGNGGIILPRVGWVRDSLAGMALVLDLLAARREPLSAIVGELPRLSMVKRKHDLAAIGGLGVVPEMIERLRREFAGAACNDADGIRFDLSEGWVHFRASNTEPIVRLIAEGVDDAAAAAIADRAARGAGLTTIPTSS